LVSFAALHTEPEANYAWVKALRTHSKHHHHGFGSIVVQKTLDMAKEMEIEEVRYATSSRNESSIGLARKLGFAIRDEVGYFRLEAPYPPRPKSSPAFVPLRVDARRVSELIMRYPDLIETSTFPISWEFENKDLDGLNRIQKKGDFFLIVDDTGEPLTLYFKRLYQRNGESMSTYSVFTRERSTFVDTMSRLIEDAEREESRRVTFFLGSVAKEWSSTLMLIPDEYNDRRFILLSKPIP
ncbi:MAG: GNAT family N-acetyltransferase, partial [Candidatus Thorarchaeota archaeon]|nr:GNAT family N-acetyltransferase [Candidatus Thorarchaeota archaeon]